MSVLAHEHQSPSLMTRLRHSARASDATWAIGQVVGILVARHIRLAVERDIRASDRRTRTVSSGQRQVGGRQQTCAFSGVVGVCRTSMAAKNNIACAGGIWAAGESRAYRENQYIACLRKIDKEWRRRRQSGGAASKRIRRASTARTALRAHRAKSEMLGANAPLRVYAMAVHRASSKRRVMKA